MSLFKKQWQVFYLGLGELRDVEAGAIWELRDLEFAGRSIPLRRSATSIH